MSNNMRPYVIPFNIWNPTPDKVFFGVHLEFNCNMSISDMSGIASQMNLSGRYTLSGNGTKIVDIKFSDLKFGIRDGIKITANTSTDILPEIQKVILKMAYNASPYTYSDNEITQLNQMYFPD